MAPHLNSATRGKSPPAVTVIVPTYNRPELVIRAVESVRRQTYDSWEVIIVDDASTTDVATAVGPLLRDSRIRRLRRSDNGGASAARNTGLQEAKGRFVCFLDDDDELLEHKLEHQVNQLESMSEDVAGVFGAWFYASRRVHKRPTGEISELRRGELLGLDYWGLQLGSGLLRRDAVAEVGFDESLPAEEHWDVCVRMLEHHRMARDDVYVMVMHGHAGERLSDVENLLSGLELAYEKYASEISQNDRLNAKWRATMAYYALDVDPERARRHAVEAVRLVPTDPRRWYLLGATFVGAAARRRLMAGYRRLGALRRLRARARRCGS